MATHSSTLAWKIPWTDGGAWSCKELDTTERLHFHLSLSGEPWRTSCKGEKMVPIHTWKQEIQGSNQDSSIFNFHKLISTLLNPVASNPNCYQRVPTLD